MLLGADFLLPVLSGLFIVMLMYIKHSSLMSGYVTVNPLEYIGPRMVIPTFVGMCQFAMGLPIVGGTPATQMFAWVGVSMSLTIMGEILVLNIISVRPDPPVKPLVFTAETKE